MSVVTGWDHPGFYSAYDNFGNPTGVPIGATGVKLGPNEEAMNAANIGQRDRVLAEQKRRFNLLYPELKTDLSNAGNGSLFASSLGPAPTITAAPIWNDQQVQQRVNAAQATADTQAESRGRDAAAGLAGRGFSGASPILAALRGRFQAQAAAQGADQARNIRWDAAQGNAGQLLKGQQAQEGAYEARANEELSRQKLTVDSRNAILQALIGLGQLG